MSEQHEGEGKMVAGGAAAGVVAGAVGAEVLSHDVRYSVPSTHSPH